MKTAAFVVFLAFVARFSMAAPAPDAPAEQTTVLRAITAQDRVLVVAPHPDDESLGAGGLLERAIAVHSKIRVVFLTNGDNNVWAQRFIEHRLYVSASDKARWGARRQKEALRALNRLGVPAKAAIFLGFPDCGTTALLMRNDPAYRAAIDSAIVAWQPTILVLPSPDDLHPDHNAGWVITHMEYRRMNAPPPPLELNYLVHTNGNPYVPERVELALTPREKQIQLEAILCHATQMALGRKRFSAYARDVETFEPPPLPKDLAPWHPVCDAVLEKSVLHLVLCLPKTGGVNGAEMDVAMESAGGDAIRLEFPVAATSADVQVMNTITRQPFGIAAVRYRAKEIAMDLHVDFPAQQVFVKFDHPEIFFDAAGWRKASIKTAGR